MKIQKFLALTLVAALALVATVSVNAQTAATTTTDTGTSISTDATTDTTGGTGGDATAPGLPNTGVGGEAATNLAILFSSGLIALAGIAFLARRVAQAR
ncbi:hypothetical protein H0W32_01535 [Patescibacteria group bacterium]|nr:hypothetical protein [Patescibacteria group bacterium]